MSTLDEVGAAMSQAGASSWQQRRRRAVRRTAWIMAAVALAIYLLAVLQSFGVI
jgi:type VI protein secretion system component VasF